MKHGWKKLNLSDVVKLNYGKALAREDRQIDGKYPVYGANGIMDRSNHFLTTGPSLVIGRKGSAGEITRVDGEFWPSDVTYFTTHNPIVVDFDFLHYQLILLELPKLARGVKPGINRNEVYSLEVKLPPLDEQKNMVRMLDEASENIRKTSAIFEEMSRELVNLRQSLLQKTFSGELT